MNINRDLNERIGKIYSEFNNSFGECMINCAVEYAHEHFKKGDTVYLDFNSKDIKLIFKVNEKVSTVCHEVDFVKLIEEKCKIKVNKFIEYFIKENLAESLCSFGYGSSTENLYIYVK